jgi:hypothetical protein
MIVVSAELYPRVRVGLREAHMTLPERALPRRRRQILSDQTGASERPDTPGNNILAHQDPPHQDPPYQDTWAGNFVDRLAGLVRKIGGTNQA